MAFRHAHRELHGRAHLREQRARTTTQLAMAFTQNEYRQRQRPLLLEAHRLLDRIQTLELRRGETKGRRNDLRTEGRDGAV